MQSILRTAGNRMISENTLEATGIVRAQAAASSVGAARALRAGQCQVGLNMRVGDRKERCRATAMAGMVARIGQIDLAGYKGDEG